MRNLLSVSILAVALVGGPVADADGDVVYKSIDAQGRVSYGDQPVADAEQVHLIHLEDATSLAMIAGSADTLSEIAATTERLRRDRLERQAERTEARRLALAPANYPTLSYAPLVERETYYRPGYPAYTYPPYRYPLVNRPFYAPGDRSQIPPYRHRVNRDHQRDRFRHPGDNRHAGRDRHRAAEFRPGPDAVGDSLREPAGSRRFSRGSR